MPPSRLAAAALSLLFTLLCFCAQASAQVRVLIVPQDSVDTLAAEINAQELFDFEVTTRAQGLGEVTLDELLEFDVVVVWTNNALEDAQAVTAGDALADFVDAGGGVVEMVFSQFSTSYDIEGRWRSQGYSCVSATDADIYTGGSLGAVDQPGHPILAGVEAFSVDNFRTGAASLLPGAELIASYGDGQILAAERGDKAGRVVWLGFYPTDISGLNGDWQRMIFQAVDYVAVGFRASIAGPGVVDEGPATIALDASNTRGDIAAFAWDLDGDGQFDDADTPQVTLTPERLDGPDEIVVSLRVTDVNNETSITERRIEVRNVPPTIAAEPPDQASIGVMYRYTIAVEDPAGPLDPLEFELLEGPEGVTFEGQVMRWTPGPEHFEQTIDFHVQVGDGDGGFDERRWSMFITAPDQDRDRVPDDVDNCPTVFNVDQLDADRDGLGDRCDDDDDNDGALDTVDNCLLTPNPDQANNDGDSEGDVCDDDDDNDFVTDDDDNCPFVTNPDQSDTDGDGVGDACTGDADRDGLLDGEDNCPLRANTDQRDSDGDGQGDACDEDDDDDGLSDEDEAGLGTDPLNPDTDGDRLSDLDEVIEHNTDPLDTDTDDDGLDDFDEVQRGTDPNNPDTDGDGLDDGDEVRRHLTDPNSADSDRGGVPDGDEVGRGTDPNNPDDDPEPEDPGEEPEPATGTGTLNTDESCACASVHKAATPGSAGWLALVWALGALIARSTRRRS